MPDERIITHHISPYHAVQGTVAEVMSMLVGAENLTALELRQAAWMLDSIAIGNAAMEKRRDGVQDGGAK